MILHTVDWDKRNKMRKQYGYTAAIVYEQPKLMGGAPACYHRLRVKEWAYKKFGHPAVMMQGDIVGTESEWFAGVTKDGEYTIAFKNAKYRNLALLM